MFAGPPPFAEAGITHKEVDHLMSVARRAADYIAQCIAGARRWQW
jgi:hypothetical protein